MSPMTKRPGSVVRASDLNTMFEAVEAVRTPSAARGLGVRGDRAGFSVFPSRGRAQRDVTVLARLNTDAGVAPLMSLVELYDHLEGEPYGPTVLEARQCRYSGLSRVGILEQGAGNGDVVSVRVGGVYVVRYDDDSIPAGETLGEGDRLGSYQNSYLAAWCMIGPLKVLGVRGAVAAGVGHAVVEITEQRGDYVFCSGATGPPAKGDAGPACTVVFGVGYTVAGGTDRGTVTVT